MFWSLVDMEKNYKNLVMIVMLCIFLDWYIEGLRFFLLKLNLKII